VTSHPIATAPEEDGWVRGARMPRRRSPAPGQSPACPQCRPTHRDPSARSYTDAITLAAAHYASGIRQTQCHVCHHWRWPWEYAEPERVATGLRWTASPAGMWYLSDRTRYVTRCGGYIWKDGQGGYVATRSASAATVARGTLADCARELVAAVPRG
jgi:hypothetical protein